MVTVTGPSPARKRSLRRAAYVAFGSEATRDDVLWALSQQFHYPYAASEDAQFHEELVTAIDPFCDQAE